MACWNIAATALQHAEQPAKMPVDSNSPIIMTTDVSQADLTTWMCLICGWIYDEAAGAPDEGLAPGTRWADVPPNWSCPECNARKEDFEMVQI